MLAQLHFQERERAIMHIKRYQHACESCIRASRILKMKSCKILRHNSGGQSPFMAKSNSPKCWPFRETFQKPTKKVSRGSIFQRCNGITHTFKLPVSGYTLLGNDEVLKNSSCFFFSIPKECKRGDSSVCIIICEAGIRIPRGDEKPSLLSSVQSEAQFTPAIMMIIVKKTPRRPWMIIMHCLRLIYCCYLHQKKSRPCY